MLVAITLMVLGLLAGVLVVQYRAYRLSGVLVVPLLAVYSLYNFLTLPLFLLAFLVAYVALFAIKRWTLLYGRSLLLTGIAMGATIPLGAAVVAEQWFGVTVFTAVEFIGTILPGIAAYNYHQLTGRQQFRDAVASLLTLAALIGVGAGLVRPISTSWLGELTPPVLLAPEADVAVLLGATVSGTGYESAVSTRVAIAVVAVGLVLAEILRNRWGLRADGIISVPLLVLFALADTNALVVYALLLGASYLLVVTMMDSTLLYGRVILSFALLTALLFVVPVVQVLPVDSGLVAFFTALFAGIGTYNFQRVSPSERLTSVVVTGGLFAFLLGIPIVARGTGDGVALPVPLWYLVAGGLLVAVSVREIYRLERTRPSLAEERRGLGGWLAGVVGLLSRGVEHRRRLSEVDQRIVVSGTRGKSGTARRLHDVFDERGYDVMAKITGNRPFTLHNGERDPVERGSKVTLYENVREIREHVPDDVLVAENQGITGYTTSIFNRLFVMPHVVVLTNVRRDHLDTLGGDRSNIARSFARSIPSGIHVVSGEQNPEIQRYLDERLAARGVSVTHVDVPSAREDVPGAEVIYALNEVLKVSGEAPLSDERLDAFLDEFRVDWTTLPNGRVFNAAEVNDVESTEAVRRSLVDDQEAVLPLLYLRPDRRSRSASFLEYLGDLHERGAVDRVHVAGAQTGVFARRADFPVVTHDVDEETAGEILDEMLQEGPPVLIVGNTVAEFMRDLESAIDERAAEVTVEDLEPLPESETDDRSREPFETPITRERSGRLDPGREGTVDGESGEEEAEDESEEAYVERPADRSAKASGESVSGPVDTDDDGGKPSTRPMDERLSGAPTDPHDGALPNRLTFVGGTPKSPARYLFEVSGFARQETDDGAPALSGERVAGSLEGDRVTYWFRGDLTDVAVSGPAVVQLNGESLPADEFPDPPSAEPTDGR